MYVKRPVYEIANSLNWDEPEFVGGDTEFIQENQLDQYSGIDVIKVDKDEQTSILISTFDKDDVISSMTDFGDNTYKINRKNSAIQGDPRNLGNANSVLNDDSITQGFRYDSNYSYRVVPSPLVSATNDAYGRRIFLSDVSTNDIEVTAVDGNNPRPVEVDSYRVVYNEQSNNYTIKIYFKPLNGDGIGKVSLLNSLGDTIQKQGFYEVSGVLGETKIYQPANNSDGFKNPPRAGTDLLLTNKTFDRQTDTILYTETIPSASYNLPLEYKIKAVSFTGQSSEITQNINLTQLKNIAKVHASIGYTGNNTPSSVVLNWLLEGEGQPSKFVEVYRGATLQNTDKPTNLTSLGIFEASTEQIEYPPGSGNTETLYEFIDDNILDFELVGNPFYYSRYAIRLIGEEEATNAKTSGFNASDFQTYRTLQRGTKSWLPPQTLTIKIEKREAKDFKNYVIPGLSAEDVRKLQNKAIITKKEFKLTSKKDVDRKVTLVIYEPKTGLFTEKKYNLKKLK